MGATPNRGFSTWLGGVAGLVGSVVTGAFSWRLTNGGLIHGLSAAFLIALCYFVFLDLHRVKQARTIEGAVELRDLLTRRTTAALFGILCAIGGLYLDLGVLLVGAASAFAFAWNCESRIRRLSQFHQVRELLDPELGKTGEDLFDALLDPRGEARRAHRSLGPHPARTVGKAMGMAAVLLALLVGVMNMGGQPTGVPTTLVTAAPVAQPSPSMTPAPSPRPGCATLVQVRATLSRGGAPDAAKEHAYLTWARLNWPTLLCPDPLVRLQGHWVSQTRLGDRLGPEIVVFADLSGAEIVHAEEQRYLEAILTTVTSISERRSFGKGAGQLVLTKAGGCGFVGHLWQQPGFYVPPAIWAALSEKLQHDGTLPFLRTPDEVDLGGVVTISFVGLTGHGVAVRQTTDFVPAKVQYDPVRGIAHYEHRSFADGACHTSIAQVASRAQQIAAAPE